MDYQSAIIHISDTEFGSKNRAEQERIRHQHKDAYKNIIDGLISDIKEEVIKKHNIKPEKIGFVISGDITDTGDKGDFAKAAQCLKYTLKQLEIPPAQIAIVPGNHDVNWNDCKEAYEAECQKQTGDEKAVKEQMRRSPVKLAKFTEFFREMCGKDFRIQRPTVFEDFEHLGTALIGLDTTYPSLWMDEDNYGAIEVEQVQNARGILDDRLKKRDKLIAVALMHHSLLPDFESDKRSFLHYAEDVKRWLVLFPLREFRVYRMLHNSC